LWQQGLSPQLLRLDGGTPAGQRHRLVDEFNQSSRRGIFLISTRAGGIGLNLTAASVVVIFDPDWNPFSDLQAQDRSFRIGQTRVVEVYRLLGAGTIEEQVYVRQVWKQQLAATAIDGMRGVRRLDHGAFGMGSLFELHESSMLPALMAEAFTTRAAPVGTSQACVQTFADMRGSVGAGPPHSHFHISESDFEDPKCEADTFIKAHVEHRSNELPANNESTEALERLHRTFDQLDHSKLMRSDTQENILLADLPAASPCVRS